MDKADWVNKSIRKTKNGNLFVGDKQVMQSWEKPLMKKLAKYASGRGGDILEIGFGLGISARFIVEYGCDSYTVVEAHPKIAENARLWAKKLKISTTVVEDFWQNWISNETDKYDGILFDTYPLEESKKGKNHYEFLPYVKDLLSEGGIYTYYSDETTDFRHTHMKKLFKHFKKFKLVKVDGLCPPPSCKYWNDDHMVIPVVKKR